VRVRASKAFYTDGQLVYLREIPGAREPLSEQEFSAVVDKLVTRLNMEGRRIGFGRVDEATLRQEIIRPRFHSVATQVHITDDA